MKYPLTHSPISVQPVVPCRQTCVIISPRSLILPFLILSLSLFLPRTVPLIRPQCKHYGYSSTVAPRRFSGAPVAATSPSHLRMDRATCSSLPTGLVPDRLSPRSEHAIDTDPDALGSAWSHCFAVNPSRRRSDPIPTSQGRFPPPDSQLPTSGASTPGWPQDPGGSAQGQRRQPSEAALGEWYVVDELVRSR